MPGNRAGPVSQFFEGYDGLKLHYQIWPGPYDSALTVICLPGLTRNARDFEDLAQHLADRFQVVCVDFRGRGRSAYAPDPRNYVPNSYVRDLVALFTALQLREAALIGTSLGGMVATLFAALRPELVTGVIINDVGPEVDPIGVARIAGYVGKAPPVVTWRDAARAVAAIDAGIYPGFSEDDWLRLARRRYVERADGSIVLDYDLDLAKAFASPETNPDQWPFFRRLRAVPTMVLRGANSDILAAATVARMQAALPGLVAVEVPGRGHVPLLDEPVAIAAIDQFLNNLPVRKASDERARRRQAGNRFRRAMARSGNSLAKLND